MENVTIISHLTPEEWRRSWNDKVIEDTNENMRASQQETCFWGHFSNARDFTICHHKEFEVKDVSLGIYFNGHLEPYEGGTRVTGKFSKKKTANLFIMMGTVLCLMALLGGVLRGDRQLMIVASVLLVILICVYLAKPRKGQTRILEHLKKISFDAKFHRMKGRKKKKQIGTENQ